MRFNLAFFLAEAFKNIRLNLLMSITAVTTTFICILVFGVGLLVSEHVEGVIGSVREAASVEGCMPGGGGGGVAGGGGWAPGGGAWALRSLGRAGGRRRSRRWRRRPGAGKRLPASRG